MDWPVAEYRPEIALIRKEDADGLTGACNDFGPMIWGNRGGASAHDPDGRWTAGLMHPVVFFQECYGSLIRERVVQELDAVSKSGQVGFNPADQLLRLVVAGRRDLLFSPAPRLMPRNFPSHGYTSCGAPFANCPYRLGFKA